MATKAVLTFGRYKGQPLGSLPANYLQWMTQELDNHWNGLARQVLSERKEGESSSTQEGGSNVSPPQSSRKVGSMVLTFGKYKGQALGSLPDVYLEWMANNMHTHWGRHAREFLDSKHGGAREVLIAQEQDGSIALKKQILACQERRDLEEAKRIHARVKASAYRNDRYIANLLMDMFGACGSADTALEIFDKIQAPNIFSWNIILKVVTQKNGCDPEAWKIFEKIPEKEKNAVSWNIMLAALAAEKGNLRKVEEFFYERMPVKDVFSWTTLLNAYITNGRFDKAREIFASLDDENVNAATWNTMMEGYARAGDMLQARKMFDSMPEKSIVSWNLMIAAYGKIHNVGEARNLFEKVKEKNQVTWNAMLSVYAQNGHLQEAKTLFSEMPKKDGASWTCLLQAHCHAGTTHDSEEILQKMPFAKTIVHWTMLLDAHAKAGNLDRAREVYDQMPDPDAIATNAMLAAYAHRGYMHEANALFEQVGDKVDAATKNIMILAHGSAGNLEASKRQFDEIIERDLYSWSSLMRAFSLSSMNEDAIHLFRRMLVEGFAPNEVVLLVYATAACGRASSLDDSRSFLANMLPDYGVSPGLDHYDCMVGAFGAAKKMEEARELIDSMPFEADARVWMTLLACCRRHLDAENGKLCAERLFVLDPENVSPYKILAEIYSQTGRENDIAGLKKMVRDKGLHKLEAESLIQIDGITHKFRVGDTAHPSIKKVRKEVARLTKLMEKDHGYKHENLGWSECGGGVHSEKLAIAYALCEKSREISLVNNLRMCGDCHTSAKMISSVVKRKITVRDTQRLHGFENGVCSCADTW